MKEDIPGERELTVARQIMEGVTLLILVGIMEDWIMIPTL